MTRGDDRRVRIWKTADCGLIASLEGSFNTPPRFNADSNYVVAANIRKEIQVSNLRGKTAASSALRKQINAVAFQPDNDALIWSADDAVRMVAWDRKTAGSEGSHFVELMAHEEDELKRTAFDAQRARLVTSSADGTAWIWKKDGTIERVLEKSPRQMLQAEFSPAPRNTRVFTAQDGSLKLWDADKGALVWARHHDWEPSMTRIGAPTVR